MKKIFFCCFIFLGFIPTTLAQRGFNANDKGVFFVSFAYNRSAYTKSDVQLNGSDYKATLHDIKLSDDYNAVPLTKFFSGSSPQFSIKLGYYISDKWAIIASFDRFNTFFVPNQSLHLEGVFPPGSNTTYTGQVNQSIDLNRSEFNLQQKNGMNYFAVGLQRNDQLYSNRSGSFAFQLVYGLKLGGIVTKVDYTYNHHTKEGISSFSGIGVGVNFDLQFSIAQYLFLQFGLDGGLLNQNKIKLGNGQDDYAKQVVGYVAPHIVLGFSIPLRGNGGCNTCPKW